MIVSFNTNNGVIKDFKEHLNISHAFDEIDRDFTPGEKAAHERGGDCIWFWDKTDVESQHDAGNYAKWIIDTNNLPEPLLGIYVHWKAQNDIINKTVEMCEIKIRNNKITNLLND